MAPVIRCSHQIAPAPTQIPFSPYDQDRRQYQPSERWQDVELKERSTTGETPAAEHPSWNADVWRSKREAGSDVVDYDDEADPL